MKMESQFALDPPSISQLFPVWESAEDILNDLNKKTILPEASMKAKKLSKLLPPLAVRLRKLCKFQGDSSQVMLLQSL